MLAKILSGAGGVGLTYSDITVVTSGASLGNAAVTFSPALQQNDVVFLIIGDNATDYTVPAGYVQITGNVITTVYKFSCFYKVMGSTPDTGINLADGNDSSGFTYYALRGVQTNSPVIEVNYTIGASSPTNLTPPALFAPIKSLFLVAGFTGNGSTASLSASPSGYSGSLVIDAAGSNDTYVRTAYKTITAAGTETPGAFTLVNSATAYAAVSIVVRPYSAGFVSAAPEFIASASTSNAVNVSTLVINKPTGTVEGDLMVAAMACDSGSRTWTGDTGWTEAADQGVDPDLRIAYKVAGASEPSSYTFTPSGSQRLSGCILTYRYAAYDTIAGSFTTGADPLILTSINTSLSQSTLIAVGARSAASITLGTPAGMTARVTDADANDPSYIVCDQPVAKGPTGTRSMSTAGSSTGVSGIMLAIKPTRSL